MSAPLDSFAAAEAFALTLPGTERTTSYGKPAVGIAANGRAFLHCGGEADTSFVAAVDLETVELLKQTKPETYWQSPHYEGWPAILIRYDSADPERVRDVIREAYAQAAAKTKARKRKT